MGVVITVMKENNRYEAVKDFAKCADPTKKGSYKHLVRVCMGRDHPTDFAKLSISVSHHIAYTTVLTTSTSVFAVTRAAEAQKSIPCFRCLTMRGKNAFCVSVDGSWRPMRSRSCEPWQSALRT